MSFEAVDLVVTDNTPAHVPMVGVTVKVFSQDGTITYSQGSTDLLGVASFLLESGITYSVRFYKFGVSFNQPLLMPVIAGGPNVFDITALVLIPPVSLDPRLCVAYGYFRMVTGAPAVGEQLIFISRFSPIWLEGSGVLNERVQVSTDEKGYVCIPLIRCGQYDVTVEGYEDTIRTIYVPDAPNVNINDLLFPIVNSVSFDPPGPYVLTIGTDLTITPTVLVSDGRTLVGSAMADVQWSSSNPSTFVVLPTQLTLVLRGLAAGVAELSVKRWDASIIHIPDPGIVGQPVGVTVL